jgi:hypothetical protein
MRRKSLNEVEETIKQGIANAQHLLMEDGEAPVFQAGDAEVMAQVIYDDLVEAKMIEPEQVLPRRHVIAYKFNYAILCPDCGEQFRREIRAK